MPRSKSEDAVSSQCDRVHQAILGVMPGIVRAIPSHASAIGTSFSEWFGHLFGLPALAMITVLTAGGTVMFIGHSMSFSGTPVSLEAATGMNGPQQPVHGAAPEEAASLLLARADRSGCAFDPVTKTCSSSSSSVTSSAEGAMSSSRPSLKRFERNPADSSSASVSQPFPQQPEVNGLNKIGIYLTSASVARDTFFKESIDKLVASGGNGIIFDVKGSRVYFKSEAPMANELGLMISSYELAETIRYAREKGLYVMGRFVAIKDEGFTSRVPEAKIRHPKSNVVLSDTWVDPSNDKAIQYNAEVMYELACTYGIDEVNLDYIRFSTANFGALMAYSAEEKADRVEKFIKEMRRQIDSCGSKTKLGISSYAILGWDFEANVKTLGQDVKRFAPYLDIISPMAYPATFTSDGYWNPAKHGSSRMYWLVKRTLTGYQELLGPEHAWKLRPWIQGYYVDTKDMTDQMKAVYDAGLCGYTVWNANNNYPSVYNAMKQFKVPERCLEPVAEPTGLAW